MRIRTGYLRSLMVMVMACAMLMTTSAAWAGSATGASLAPLRLAQGQPAGNGYIVVLKAGVRADGIAAAASVRIRRSYTTVLNGFAADLDAGQLQALRQNPNVAYIEQDSIASIKVTQPMDPNGDPWGLDRIDQRNLPLSRSYTYTATGAGVTAYIIDTGLQANHPDFGGRAQNVFDGFGGNGNDCHGHGTHVAGTIGGTTYGVAKQVNLRGVRVLDCGGSGPWSVVIAGIDWVAANGVRPAVANMSLGGSYVQAVNDATTNLVNRGVFTAVAAGNSFADACQFSPASTPTAYTVAASDKTDARASFSNYGPCVDGYAPGVAIKSDSLNSGTATLSGTSMASPHVAGVAVLYKSVFGDAPAATITNWLNANATPNVITGNPAGTPNRLLFVPVLVAPLGWYWNYDATTGALVGSGDLTSVARYASGPCAGRAPTTCVFDSREIFNNLESITAYGSYWNYNVSTGALVSSGNLNSVARYASGPCAGRAPGTCTFDSRAFINNIESITAYGSYWNYDATTGALVSSGNLNSVARYASGPCAGRAPGTCTFDSRTIFNNLESITAYGSYWNYNATTGALVSSGNLNNVARYAGGPCAGRTPGTCKFTTRAFVNNIESITN